MTFPLSSEDEQVLSHTEGTYKAIQLHTVAMLQSSQESHNLHTQLQVPEEQHLCHQVVNNFQQFQRQNQPLLLQPSSDTSSRATPKKEEQIICDNSRAQQRMEIMKQQIQEIKKRQEDLIKVEEVDEVVQLNQDLVSADQKHFNPNLMQVQQSQTEEFSTKQSSTNQLNQKQTIDSRYKTLQLNPNSSQQSFQPMQMLSGKASTKYNLLKNVIEQSFQSKGAVGKSSSLEGRTLGTTHSFEKNHYSTLQSHQHETRSVAHPVMNLDHINSSHYSTVQPSPHQHSSIVQHQQQNFDFIQHYQSQQQQFPLPQQTTKHQQQPPFLISQILQNKQQPDNSVLLQEIALLQQREAILQHQLQKAKGKAEKERMHWEQQMGHMQQEVGQLNQLINELMQEKMTTGGQQPYRCKCKTKIRDLERQVLDLHRQLYFVKRGEQQPQQPSFICNNMMSPKNNNLSAIIGAADITPSQNQSKKKSRCGSEAQRSNSKSRSRSKTPQAYSLNQSGIAPQRSKSRSQSRSINNSKCEKRSRSKELKIVTSPKQTTSTTKQMKENTQLLNNKGPWPQSAKKKVDSKENKAKATKAVKNSMKKVISIPKIRNDDSLPTLEQLKHMKSNTLAKEAIKSKQQKALTK